MGSPRGLPACTPPPRPSPCKCQAQPTPDTEQAPHPNRPAFAPTLGQAPALHTRPSHSTYQPLHPLRTSGRWKRRTHAHQGISLVSNSTGSSLVEGMGLSSSSLRRAISASWAAKHSGEHSDLTALLFESPS